MAFDHKRDNAANTRLLDHAKNGSQEQCLNVLVDQYMPLLNNTVNTYCYEACDREDFLSEAKIALIEAYYKFDVKKAKNQLLQGWLKLHVVAAVREFKYRESHVCKIPSSREYKNMFWLLPKHLPLGRRLRIDEAKDLAQMFETSESIILDMDTILRPGTVQLDHDNWHSELAAKNVSEGTQEYDIDELDERAQKVAKLRLLNSEPVKLARVASIVGVSITMVRKIESEVMEHLSQRSMVA